MKKILCASSLALILTMASSCGKKSNESSTPRLKDNLQETVRSEVPEESHQDLIEAIKEKNTGKVREILATKNRLFLNRIQPDGETLMTTAVLQNSIPIIDALREHNVSISTPNKIKQTPIMVAARMGFIEIMKRLIALGASTNDKDQFGNTALHLAIYNSKEEAAIFLINNKTDLQIANNENETPLMVAQNMNLKNVAALLSALTETPEKNTLRNVLIFSNAESLSALLNKYPHLLKDYSDLDFYILVLRSHDHDEALSMVKVLINNKASLNTIAESDSTALTEAIGMGQKYEDLVELFLAAGANPNIPNKNNETPLILAVRQNSYANARALLNHNAKRKFVSLRAGKIFTACHEARKVRKSLKTNEDKHINIQIIKILGCGMR